LLDVLPGELRTHAQIGACEIFALEGRDGILVAVTKDGHGRPSGVYDVEVLDDRGWSVPRKKNGWDKAVVKKARELREQGYSYVEIGKRIGTSRSVAGRMAQGVEVKVIRKRQAMRLSDEDREEIRSMLERDWTASIIANWIGCSEQSIRDEKRRMKAEQYE